MRRRESNYAGFPRDVLRLLRAAGSPRVPNYAGRLTDRPAAQRVRHPFPAPADGGTDGER